jgi:hypothetical protein
MACIIKGVNNMNINKEEALQHLEAIKEEVKTLEGIINKPDQLLYNDLKEGQYFKWPECITPEVRLKLDGGHVQLGSYNPTFYPFNDFKYRPVILTNLHGEPI